MDDLNPTGRFTSRAADYRRFRPDYPAAAVDAILDGLGPPASLLAADVGSGTGISSRLLAARGVRVVAIEPNAAMRAAAEPHPGVEWREGTAEATGLADAGVGLVMCAQAFHWFREAEALREFHRILKPSGRLALMWNSRDGDDPFTRGYKEAIGAVGGDSPSELRPFDPALPEAGGLFGPVRTFRGTNAQQLDFESLLGRATSASTVPREGPDLARLQQLLADLHARYRDAAGRVTLRYRTDVFLCERRDPD